jgi:hypothetical protein
LNCSFKKSKKPGIILPLEGLTKPQKILNLSKLGYFSFIADIYGEGNYPKTTLKRVKVLAITKQTTKLTKRIALALEQLVKSGANQIIL